MPSNLSTLCSGRGGAHAGAGLGLDNHHAHVVGHHVVQLTGDAHPLVGDGPFGPGIPLGHQALGPRLHLRPIGVPGPLPLGQRPGDAGEGEGGEIVHGVGVTRRRCRDEHCHGRDRHRQVCGPALALDDDR